LLSRAKRNYRLLLKAVVVAVVVAVAVAAAALLLGTEALGWFLRARRQEAQQGAGKAARSPKGGSPSAGRAPGRAPELGQNTYLQIPRRISKCLASQ
jgi:hypothetical protein